MSVFELTPQRNQKQQSELFRRSQGPSVLFWFATALPAIVYLLFYFGVFSATPTSEFKDWEEATALVTAGGASGTAFLVSYEKLLTARHVVEDVEEGGSVTLIFDRADPKITTTATLEWKDDTGYPDNDISYFTTDVAVLRLDDPSVVEILLPFSLGNSDDAQPLATEVVAVGYPIGDFSITRGDINSDNFEGKELFKVNVATNPGNSGGPLLSLDDDTVIGMLVGQRGGVVQGENIANKANNITMLLKKNGISIE